MTTPPETLIQHPIRHYIRKEKRAFVIGVLFLLLTNLLDALFPWILKVGIDTLTLVLTKPDLTGQNQLEIAKIAALMFISMGLLAWTRFGWRIFWGIFHTHSAEDLRKRIFAKLTLLGPRFFNKNPIGELMSLITNDVNSFRQGIGPGLLILFDGISIILIVIPMMLALNVKWTLKTLVFLPFVPFLIWKIMMWIYEAYKKSQDKLGEMTGVSQEIIGGIRVIKSFAQEKNRTDYFNQFSKSYEESSNKLAWVDSFFNIVTQSSYLMGTGILFWVGAPEVIQGVVSIGTFVAFQSYIQRMIWPLSALGMGFSNVQKGLASFSRIRDLLITPSVLSDQGTRKLENFESLEVRDLTFSYDQGPQVLNHLNFKIHHGETIGITGPVGSGKSTLLSLLMGLYPVGPGQILINGISIEEYDLISLRKVFTLVTQEPFLFSDSVVQNIYYGSDSSRGDLKEVLKAVDIEAEIEKLPDKENSELGERGINLSGGQKQRLSMARGLVLNPFVLILDDTLSAVDSKTEKNIQRHLFDQQIQKQTKIIISHRVSTLQNVDRILVMKDGFIEAQGVPKNLIKESATYKTMVQLQGASS